MNPRFLPSFISLEKSHVPKNNPSCISAHDGDIGQSYYTIYSFELSNRTGYSFPLESDFSLKKGIKKVV